MYVPKTNPLGTELFSYAIIWQLLFVLPSLDGDYMNKT